MDNEARQLIEERFATLSKQFEDAHTPQLVRIKALEITANNLGHLASNIEELVKMTDILNKYILNGKEHTNG